MTIQKFEDDYNDSDSDVESHDNGSDDGVKDGSTDMEVYSKTWENVLKKTVCN